MRIQLHTAPSLEETVVTVACPALDDATARLLASLQAFGRKLTGQADGQAYLLDPEEVLYIDTVDKLVFLYTRQAVYESPLRLYELEERLAGCGFLRAGKSCLVNLDRVRSIRPELGGRLQLTMESGERLFVSRQYAPAFKQILGL